MNKPIPFLPEVFLNERSCLEKLAQLLKMIIIVVLLISFNSSFVFLLHLYLFIYYTLPIYLFNYTSCLTTTIFCCRCLLSYLTFPPPSPPLILTMDSIKKTNLLFWLKLFTMSMKTSTTHTNHIHNFIGGSYMTSVIGFNSVFFTSPLY